MLNEGAIVIVLWRIILPTFRRLKQLILIKDGQQFKSKPRAYFICIMLTAHRVTHSSITYDNSCCAWAIHELKTILVLIFEKWRFQTGGGSLNNFSSSLVTRFFVFFFFAWFCVVVVVVVVFINIFIVLLYHFTPHQWTFSTLFLTK